LVSSLGVCILSWLTQCEFSGTRHETSLTLAVSPVFDVK